jgi:nicotinic acid mononucleotide adenylyltransferase
MFLLSDERNSADGLSTAMLSAEGSPDTTQSQPVGSPDAATQSQPVMVVTPRTAANNEAELASLRARLAELESHVSRSIVAGGDEDELEAKEQDEDELGGGGGAGAAAADGVSGAGKVPEGAEGGGAEATVAAVDLQPPLAAPKDVKDPLKKIGDCLRQHPGCKKKSVVLVSCGAYNPVHLMQIREFYIARQFFAGLAEYRVVGGLMSPCHDTHVRVKTRITPKQMITRRHRLELCREAVRGSSWIDVDRWDITRRRVMDYLSVMEHAQEICEKQFPGREFRLVYVCRGSHLLTLSPKAMRERGFACIAICRPGDTDELMRQIPTSWTGVAHVVEDSAILRREMESASEVTVRQALIARQDVAQCVGNKVARYMQRNKIADKIAGRLPWTAEDKEWNKGDESYVKATLNEAPPQKRVVKPGEIEQLGDAVAGQGMAVIPMNLPPMEAFRY